MGRKFIFLGGKDKAPESSGGEEKDKEREKEKQSKEKNDNNYENAKENIKKYFNRKLEEIISEKNKIRDFLEERKKDFSKNIVKVLIPLTIISYAIGYNAAKIKYNSPRENSIITTLKYSDSKDAESGERYESEGFHYDYITKKDLSETLAKKEYENIKYILFVDHKNSSSNLFERTHSPGRRIVSLEKIASYRNKPLDFIQKKIAGGIIKKAASFEQKLDSEYKKIIMTSSKKGKKEESLSQYKKNILDDIPLDERVIRDVYRIIKNDLDNTIIYVKKK